MRVRSLICLALLLAGCAGARPLSEEARPTAAVAAPELELQPLPAYRGVHDCREETPEGAACRVTTAPSAADLRVHLGNRRAALWLQGDTLTAAYRTADEGVTEVELGGGIQLPMARVKGSDVWLLSLRLPDAARAVVDLPVWVTSAADFSQDRETFGVWRGPEAPPAAPRSDHLAGRLFIDSIMSEAMGSNQGFTVYLPPGHTRDRRLPVVYLTDGQNVTDYAPVVDAAIVGGHLPPVILVGVWVNSRGPEGRQPRGPHEDPRAIAYHEEVRRMPAADSAFVRERYESHRRWFTEEVRRWAEDSLGASTERRWRAVQGNSSGAHYVMTLGRERDDVYGAVIAFSNSSVGAMRRSAGQWATAPVHYLAAGVLEPTLHEGLRTLDDTLRTHGVPSHLNIYPSGHDYKVWIEMLPAALAWWLNHAANR